jgi:hypothetical protein
MLSQASFGQRLATELTRSCKMTHFLADESRLGDYRFAGAHAKRVRSRTALRRVNGYLKNMIDAVANAKLRRVERERACGTRFDRPNND